jgi:CheY-like chemotaxis protein
MRTKEHAMTTQARVLVVDDDPVVARSIDRVLTGKGYAVITASDGPEALEKLAREKYDAVFTDIRMPGMDGFEVAKRIKATQPWLPVVIVTGYGSPESKARAKELGVAGFLHKPLSPDMIEGSAREATGRAAARYAQAAIAAAAEVAPPAEQVDAATESVPVAAPRARQAAKNVALFVAAPFIGLAYTLAFPFVGLALLVRFGYRAFRTKAK